MTEVTISKRRQTEIALDGVEWTADKKRWEILRDYAEGAGYAVGVRGDVVVGDQIIFARATFQGGGFGRFRRKPKFTGYEIIEGEVVRESYGAEKQQHTFTIVKEDGEKMRIKGRNLYSVGVFCKNEDRSERTAALAEKHARGDAARADRAERLA